MITRDTRLADLEALPFFSAMKGCFIAGGDFFVGDNANLTLSDLQRKNPTWSASDMVFGLDRLSQVAQTHDQYVFPLENQSSTLIWVPAVRSMRTYFAILLAGGAYGAVCTMVEALPAAAELNRLGIDCFCLNYRTATPDDFVSGLFPKPMDDLASALRFIIRNSERFGLKTDEYLLCGFSAGGHLASVFGTNEVGARHYGMKNPFGLLLGYPLISLEYSEDTPLKSYLCRGMFGSEHSEQTLRKYNAARNIDRRYPSVFLVRAEDDVAVPATNGDSFCTELKTSDVACKMKTVRRGGHGFGLGSETAARGWMKQGIAFLERMRTKVRDLNFFYDLAGLVESPGIHERARVGHLQRRLDDIFVGNAPSVRSIKLNESGVYRRGFRTIDLLPPYYDIRLSHSTGTRMETIIVWVPLSWNDRFIGCGGGGTSTGGERYIGKPDNTSRGMTLPKAVMNGFSAAITDAGNPENVWAFDVSGRLSPERLTNWHQASTHFMSLFGKAVSETLHGRSVKYSYFHGGSGGGRQAMVEAQEYPSDYDGIWASSPAIRWNRFLPMGAWPIAVMNAAHRTVSEKNMRRFMEAAHERAGGQDAYYRTVGRVDLDPGDLVGRDGMTKADADVIRTMFAGPIDANGNRLSQFFRPGVMFWNKVIPIGAYYYDLFGKPKPFFLTTFYLRWVTGNPKATFRRLDILDFTALLTRSIRDLGWIGADKTDLGAFFEHGGKLIIDHGTDDPLIPVDGTVDYYQEVVRAIGCEKAERFIRVYITPGDGHGSCNWHAPGITEGTGMSALLRWVEDHVPPEELPTVRVNHRGNTVETGRATPYRKP